MTRRKRNSYFINVTDTRIAGVSAKEFKELSRKWDKEEPTVTRELINGAYHNTSITIYTAEGIECGRIVSHW